MLDLRGLRLPLHAVWRNMKHRLTWGEVQSATYTQIPRLELYMSDRADWTHSRSSSPRTLAFADYLLVRSETSLKFWDEEGAALRGWRPNQGLPPSPLRWISESLRPETNRYSLRSWFPWAERRTLLRLWVGREYPATGSTRRGVPKARPTQVREF